MSRIFSTLVLLCSLCASFLVHPAAAATRPPGGVLHVFLQLNGAPLAADPAFKVSDKATRYRTRLDVTLPAARWYAQQLIRYQNQEISYLRAHGIDISVQYRFHVLFNGVAATIPASQINSVRGSLNVTALTIQHKLQRLDDHSLPLVNVAGAWALLGGSANAGRGLMIAQIDTGIDPSSPCFSDKGMPSPPFTPRADNKGNLALTNNKVIVARAFGPDSTQQYSAADQVGHGTFGAAIEACDSNTQTPIHTDINGLAPGAYVMNYNVFPKGSEAANYDPIPNALEAAVEDGADVINMSLGSGLGAGVDRLDPDEIATENAIKAGTTVVISAGNAGPTTQTVSSPAAAPDAIAVGATTNSRGLYSSIAVQGPTSVPSSLGQIEATESSHQFSQVVGPAQVVDVGLGRLPADDQKNVDANDFAGKDLHGKIALIQRGILTFDKKVNNAAQAGAVGAIIYNNDPEAVGLLEPSTPTATLPAMFIRNTDGLALQAWVKDHPDSTLQMDPAIHAFDNIANVLSDFSSRGYGANFSIKPDLVAPGQDIYSATETSVVNNEMYNPSGFVSADGTSFSAPHVTGAVALLLQKHPKWTPAMIKAALVETATDGVYLDDAKTQVASIMDMGGGLLNVGNAVGATAYVSPYSLSFGAVNVGSGAVHQSPSVTLNDAANGAGNWQVSATQLHGGSGVSVTAPATVSLPAGGKVSVPLQLSVAANATGDYDGSITLVRGSETLHVPYFVHVMSQPVKAGSVLLVDDTTSRYQAPYGLDPVVHLDVSSYFETALTKIGRSYTYWDEARLGTPTLADMKQASAVLYFTGANLNAWNPENSNNEELEPPLGPSDVTALDAYLRGGGHVFLTGMGASLSDPYFAALDLGGVLQTTSVYDTLTNDKQHVGGISPTSPSAQPARGKGVYSGVGPFVGLKQIDFSTKGNGAKDNLAGYNKVLEDFMGVGSIAPFSGFVDNFYGSAYGQAAVQATSYFNNVPIGVVSSAEPTFKQQKLAYTGRSVFFSFGLEGVNDDSGFATREDLLQRIFQWFGDQPAATVQKRVYRSRAKVTLAATVRAGAPARAAVFTWQVGSKTLKATSKPTPYVFPHPGKYRLRVQVTDSLGHQAVSAWTSVTVR